MKNAWFASLMVLTLAGFVALNCYARKYSNARNQPGGDDAKVVARLVARTASAPLTFKDKISAEQIISALDSSKRYTFGVILDLERKVFAEYFRADYGPEKERFLAAIVRGLANGKTEALVMDHGYAIAIVPMETNGKIVGYAAVGRKGA